MLGILRNNTACKVERHALESAEDPVRYLDEALEDLAGRRAPVGHLIVWHAVDNDAPKAVLVRAPVRVDMEASAVDGSSGSM